MAAIGGLVYFSGSDVLRQSRLSRMPALDTTPGGARQAESQQYQRTLEQANDANSETAQRNRESFVATPETIATPLDPPKRSEITPWVTAMPEDDAVPPPLVQSNPTIRGPRPRQRSVEEQSGPQRTAPSEPSAPAVNPWTNLIAQQASSIIGAWTPTTSRTAVLIEEEDAPEAGGAPESGTPGTAAEAADGSTGAVIIPAGTILYGEAVTTTTSDGPGAPVVVEITVGAFKGARLIGRFEVAERTNRMVIQFGSITLADGETLSANAYAVDGRSAETAIASDVDHRLLQRYGPLLAAAFIAGFGETASEVGSSIVAIGDSAVISTDAPDLENALFAGLGEVGSVIAEDIRSATPAGPLVKLEAGWPVATLFVQPVERSETR
ncbi:hypothetical protein HNS03_18900 [Amorphus sp. 3PC139-8]